MGAIEKVIRAFELEGHTQRGWEVVEQFEDGIKEELHETTLHPGVASGTHPHHNNGTIALTKWVTTRVVFFRVRMSDESLLAAMAQKVENFNNENTSLRFNVSNLNKELSDEKKKYADLSASSLRATRHLQEQNDVIHANYTEVDNLRRRLEKDINKVRDDIGKKRFDEILPPDRHQKKKETK